MYLDREKMQIGLCLLSTILPIAAHSCNKQNVIFILADDLGWADLSCNGSKFYETPNIDRLAQKGIFFSNAHAASPVSSPARGAIMTGKYPSRTRYTGLLGQWGKPSLGRLIDADFSPNISAQEFTLAEAFKEGGYKTLHLGKWHLGESEETMPLNQGVDVNITGYEEGKWQAQRFNEKGEFVTDILTNQTLKIIKKNRDKPFFLNLWYYAVHTPIRAKEKDIEYFKEKAKRLGLDTVNPIEEAERFPAVPWFIQRKGGKRGNLKRRMFQSDPVYAAFLYCLDQNIGRIMQLLNDLKLNERTTIVFFSDNGGLSTSEGSPTCNIPLKDGKGWDSEGGVRVPLIIYSPVVNTKEHVCDSPVVGTDLYPTLLELCGLPLCEKQHVDGVSMVPLLNGKEVKRKPIYWHSPHYFNQGGYPFSAVMDGDWKYLFRYDMGTSYLYNLKDDIGEKNNIIQQNQKQAELLKALLDSFLKEVNALYPKKNPNYEEMLKKTFN